MSQKAHSRDLSVFGWRCLAGQVRVSPRHLQTGRLINPTGSVNNRRVFILECDPNRQSPWGWLARAFSLITLPAV